MKGYLKVEDWMEALQATIVKRENMEHQHASGPVSAEHTKQHGVVGVGLSIDSTGTDEGNNNNNSTGRKSLDLNPLHKIAQKFSKSHERDTVVGGNVDNAGNYNDTHRIGGRTRNDSDSNSLEGSGDMMMRAVDVDRKLNEIESITLEDPPLPSDDLEVLPHTIREDPGHHAQNAPAEEVRVLAHLSAEELHPSEEEDRWPPEEKPDRCAPPGPTWQAALAC